MESAHSATTYLQRADAQLHALLRALGPYDGLVGVIIDRELRVTRYTVGAEPISTTVTCAPRPSDQDRLWFWASDRTPLGEADKIQDSALALASILPSQR